MSFSRCFFRPVLHCRSFLTSDSQIFMFMTEICHGPRLNQLPDEFTSKTGGRISCALLLGVLKITIS